jgi:hypothetical protein
MKFIKIVESIFTLRDPQRISVVPALLREWERREEALLQFLAETYDIDMGDADETDRTASPLGLAGMSDLVGTAIGGAVGGSINAVKGLAGSVGAVHSAYKDMLLKQQLREFYEVLTTFCKFFFSVISFSRLFAQVYAPDKVDNINTIASQFAGRTDELWARLEQKYALEPGSALAFIQDEEEDDDDNEDDPFGFIKDPYSYPQHTTAEPSLEEKHRVTVAHQRKQARQAVQARLMKRLQLELQQEGLTRAEQFYQVINATYNLKVEPEEQEGGAEGGVEGGAEGGAAKEGAPEGAAAATAATSGRDGEQVKEGDAAEKADKKQDASAGEEVASLEAVFSSTNSGSSASSSSTSDASPRSGGGSTPRSPRLPPNHPALDGEGGQRWKYGDQMVGEKVQRALLHSLAFKGIPDEAQALRPLVWRLLLGYVPLHRSQWEDELKSKRQLYTEYCSIFLKGGLASGAPGEDGHGEEALAKAKEEERIRKEVEATQKDAAEAAAEVAAAEAEVKKKARAETRKGMTEEEAEADEEAEQEERVEELLRKEREEEDNRNPYDDLVFEIKKDVDRTHQDLSFFNQPATHSSVMRILLVYASLNPGVKYVQGMNEIVAPLFYVLSLDVDESWKKHAEADTFFCFTNLMAEIRDHFLVSLDNAEGGIKSKIHQVPTGHSNPPPPCLHPFSTDGMAARPA